MGNPLCMGCCLVLALGAVLTAQPPSAPEKAPASAKTPGAPPEKEKIRHMLRPVSEEFLTFVGPNTPVAAKFRFGSFGMAYVSSPVTTDSEELHLIRKSRHLLFKKEGQGWRFVSKDSLPPGPNMAQLSMGGGKSPDAADKPIAPQSFTRISDEERQITGHQMDEKGNLYWIGRETLYRHTEGGWRLLWNFPKELTERRNNPSCRGYVAILPRNRIALVGTTDAFIKILELPHAETAESVLAAPQTAEPKLLGSISYQSIGFEDFNPSKTPLVNFSSMPFLATDECLYFYIGNLGRFFRMRLDSFSLNELDTPWVALMDSNTWGGYTSRKWRPSENPPVYPVLPWTIAFAPRPDGTVHARALMWNMDPAVIYSFELGSEGSSIKAEIHMEAEMPEPIVLLDPQGNLVPIENFIRPDPAASPQTSKRALPTPTAGNHPLTQPSTSLKEN